LFADKAETEKKLKAKEKEVKKLKKELLDCKIENKERNLENFVKKLGIDRMQARKLRDAYQKLIRAREINAKIAEQDRIIEEQNEKYDKLLKNKAKENQIRFFITKHFLVSQLTPKLLYLFHNYYLY
jgi:protein subunit release factor A